MIHKKIILPLLLLLCQIVLAQNDTINLHEVIVSDTQLKDFSHSQSVLKLNDSVISKNPGSLTSLLMYNSVIYFKENGLGMVSSPSFRGTTAQQTAVVWNGININSQLNGQTDFNVLNTRDFNSISVRAGGGSVIYGSSAIGGSIHLNNELEFTNRFTNTLRTDYGSYNTFGAHYNLRASTDKVSTNISVTRNSSDNDYDYPGTNLKNENGQYYNTSVNAAFGYKINHNNLLRFYSYLFDGERHFSGTLAAPSRSKYQDTNTRNLLEWTGYYGRFTSKLKTAYLEERYKYFENAATDFYTVGKVKTFLARYDLAYAITNAITLNTIVDYTQNRGEGSDIDNKNRNIGSGSLLMRHAVTEKFNYELGIRKEISNVYNSPVLFSAGGSYDVTSFYKLKLNGSRNYRIPTFNDLYWQGAGNPALKPESSYQAEMGNVFHVNDFSLSLTGYYISLKNMLRWIPGSDNLWRPENVGKAHTYGLESILNWKKKYGSNIFDVNATYAYTVSREEGSTEQMIYVPFHKATASIAYSYKNLSAYYRQLYNGKVYTASDNSATLKDYWVAGIGVEYTFKTLKGLSLGAQVQNLFDAEYQNVEVRPMPGRNYNVYLNLNI